MSSTLIRFRMRGHKKAVIFYGGLGSGGERVALTEQSGVLHQVPT
ncbi:MAG: hypothetical protein RR419_09185 [Akkermansia sp.]